MSWASDETARRTMLANRRRDTAPELAVRRILHAVGARYRVDFPPLEGKSRADIVFTRQHLAVFIDGCFWHRCPEHATDPKRNREYWEPKLRRNVERDRETDARLVAAGWRVLRFWEHEPATSVAATILATLAATATTTTFLSSAPVSSVKAERRRDSRSG